MNEQSHRRNPTAATGALASPTSKHLIALTTAVMLAGCSFIFTKGPQSNRNLPTVYPDCTSSMSWPVIDSILSMMMLGIAISDGVGDTTETYTPEEKRVAVIEGALNAAVLAASAYIGYSRVSRCRKVRESLSADYPGYAPDESHSTRPLPPNQFASPVEHSSSAQQPEVHIGVRAPLQPVSTEAQPLDLTVRIRAERDGQRWGVAAGDTLKTGDLLELFIYLNQPAYLYVVQAQPDGTFTALFPEKGDRLLTGGREHRIPDVADESFQLGPQDKEENIYILMSRVPLAQASALLSARDPLVLSADDKRLDSPPPDPPRRERTATEPGPASLKRTDRVLTITTRRVIRVNRLGGTPTVMDVAESRDNSTLIVRLYFKHS